MARRAAPSPRVWAALGIAAAIGAVTFLIWWATSPPAPAATAPQAAAPPKAAAPAELGPPRGGELSGSIPEAPLTFNPYVADGDQHEAVAALLHARLFRVNRTTDQLEPFLAASSSTTDRLTYRIVLREHILWSDGAPFSANDVVFSFRAAYDRQSTGSTRRSLEVAGKPIAARAIDPLTVELTFPAPFAPELRLLDRLPMLPRHTLEPALNAGTFARTWPLGVRASDVVGLGPFVLGEPGPKGPGPRALQFARNPRYWRKAPADGGPLPYLDGIALSVAGGPPADFSENQVPPESYAELRRAEQAGMLRVYDLGPGLDSYGIAFNLAGPNGSAPRAGRPWLANQKFRLAISTALDRRAFCKEVFAQACDPVASPVTPGNAAWFNPEVAVTRANPPLARSMLAELGLLDRNADGVLEDEAGRPVQFTMLVPRGERAASFVSLKDVGIRVDTVQVERAALRARLLRGDYDAVFDRIRMRDTDPAMNMDFWLGLGVPAISELMLKQAAAQSRVERVQLFAQVQRIFAEQVPMVVLGAPHVRVATSTRVLNATPSIARPYLLWNAEGLAALR